MPTMVETRPVTCPSCGKQTITLCSCTAGSVVAHSVENARHCPRCAKVPEHLPHVWIAQGRP